ncbi:MAG: leucine-rich repeat domain-containing protein, partial [Muribaculaceae bacterium]|nr:leucine-rich repeat domain-containing protein [Muribaculaceae bacterium]
MKKLIFAVIFSLSYIFAQALDLSLGGMTYTLNTETKEATLIICFNNNPQVVHIPATIAHKGETYTVVAIGDYCFYNKSTITAVDFDEASQIRSIGKKSFMNCNKIESLDLPDEVTTLGSYSFASCSTLTTLELPAKLETMAEGSFSECTSLTEVSIPAQVSTIGKDCFTGCSALQSVNFQGNPENIDQSAFDGCSALTKKELILDAGNIKTFYSNNNVYTDIVMRRANASHKLATISLPFKPNKQTRSNFAFYEFEGVNDNGILSFKETDSPQADMPYVVKSLTDSEIDEFVAESENGMVTLSSDGEQSVTSGDWTFHALYHMLMLTDSDALKHYYLPNDNGIAGIAEP